MVRWMITFGVLLVVGSILWPYLRELGLARLPGDMIVELAGYRLHLPLATSLLISSVIAGAWRMLEP